ncbi:PREDICTED: ankyrin repeat-containing protein At2g01680 [Tarenaya hassleriana]|uniref:ankyrin repeat-containing protein At2g01680 n=1 Tax=Tarenaya hassleriana TaxID=28532 RepID=UPI00053C1301|nr:PREDICTED: ankyrin repeat-containing protein At2g01680 [Tarenaya hassleriana]
MEAKQLRFLTHQAFFSAVRSGNLDHLKQILDRLTRDETSDEPSPSPSSTSSSLAVSDLMAVQNDAGETAVYIAAAENLEEMFSYLIRFCNVETVKIRSKSDLNSFHVAAKRGHLGIVKELLSLWPELCGICDSSNTSPLYSAAVQDHFDVVNVMLDVDPSCSRIVRKNGKTCALHMAAKGQNAEVVEEILHAGYPILNERDRKGNTALHIATRKSRPQIVSLLLAYTSIEVNAVNNQKETAMDLADRLQYGGSALEINEALIDAGAKHGRYVGQEDETMALKRAVSDIKHEVQSQLLQNEKTNRRVSGIAKELRKLHREAVQNTTNSITVVAVLFASIGFLAIFNLPGQYFSEGPEVGKAEIAGRTGFRVFCLLNATSLFISLAVVVVQITLVAWDTRAQKKVVAVVNKLMWAACGCTFGAFLAIAFVVVGKGNSWMAMTVTLLGAPILVGTLASMSYFVFRQRFGCFRSDSQRRIKRASGSKSFSWSYSAHVSDLDDESDLDKIIAL